MAGAWDWVAETGDLRIGVTTSRRELTTSTVLAAGSEVLLVDPSWDPDELSWIADSLSAAGLTVTAGFATHAHHDHVLWHPGLGSAPRWASGSVATLAAGGRGELVESLGPGWPADLLALVGRLTPIAGEQLPWPGTQIQLITHDAHAPGHTALWIPAAKVLIAGDMLSDVELPLLEQSSTADYAGGLDALHPFAQDAEVIIPGHGHPAVGREHCAARWRTDRAYLDALIAGAENTDPRLRLPGMREAHRANRTRAHQ